MLVPEYENDNFLYEYMAAKVIAAEIPPLPSDDINPNLTLGEMLEKNISPPGMIPVWTPEARKKYEACAKPHIDKYKIAVDKLNKQATTTYEDQTDDYLSSNLGIGGIKSMYDLFLSDKAISARYSPQSATKGVRVIFWVTFI